MLNGCPLDDPSCQQKCELSPPSCHQKCEPPVSPEGLTRVAGPAHPQFNGDSKGIPVENGPRPPPLIFVVAPYGNWGMFTIQKCKKKTYATFWYPRRTVLSREIAFRALFMIFSFSPSQNTSKMCLFFHRYVNKNPIDY